VEGLLRTCVSCFPFFFLLLTSSRTLGPPSLSFSLLRCPLRMTAKKVAFLMVIIGSVTFPFFRVSRSLFCRDFEPESDFLPVRGTGRFYLAQSLLLSSRFMRLFFFQEKRSNRCLFCKFSLFSPPSANQSRFSVLSFFLPPPEAE